VDRRVNRQRALCAPRHLYRMRQSHLGRVTVRSANMTLIPRCSDGTRLFNSHGVADRANGNGHLRSVEQPCWLVHLRRKSASARGLGNLSGNQASRPGGNHIGVTSVVPTAMVCVPVHRSHQTQRRSGYRDDSIQGCEAQPFARNILGPHSAASLRTARLITQSSASGTDYHSENTGGEYKCRHTHVSVHTTVCPASTFPCPCTYDLSLHEYWYLVTQPQQPSLQQLPRHQETTYLLRGTDKFTGKRTPIPCFICEPHCESMMMATDQKYTCTVSDVFNEIWELASLQSRMHRSSSSTIYDPTPTFPLLWIRRRRANESGGGTAIRAFLPARGATTRNCTRRRGAVHLDSPTAVERIVVAPT
jgi:hypothetical protein